METVPRRIGIMMPMAMNSVMTRLPRNLYSDSAQPAMAPNSTMSTSEASVTTRLLLKYSKKLVFDKTLWKPISEKLSAVGRAMGLSKMASRVLTELIRISAIGNSAMTAYRHNTRCTQICPAGPKLRCTRLGRNGREVIEEDDMDGSLQRVAGQLALHQIEIAADTGQDHQEHQGGHGGAHGRAADLSLVAEESAVEEGA